jgi:hypothetical protein
MDILHFLCRLSILALVSGNQNAMVSSRMIGVWGYSRPDLEWDLRHNYGLVAVIVIRHDRNLHNTGKAMKNLRVEEEKLGYMSSLHQIPVDSQNSLSSAACLRKEDVHRFSGCIWTGLADHPQLG